MNNQQPFANVTLWLNRFAADTASVQTLTLHSALADWSGVPDLTGAVLVMDVYPLRSGVTGTNATAQQQAVYGLPSAAQFEAHFQSIAVGNTLAVVCEAPTVQTLIENRYVFTVTARLLDDSLVLLADGQLMMRHTPSNNQDYN
jgi:hypothetical protein